MCSFCGCEKVALSAGLCRGHLAQRYRGHDLRPLRPWNRQAGPCAVKWCDRPAQAHRLCQAHNLTARRYGLSHEQVAEVLARRECSVCGAKTDIAAAIDHDHACCPGRFSCGKCVRGVLCTSCNMAIGYVHDDPARLEALARYLREHAMQ